MAYEEHLEKLIREAKSNIEFHKRHLEENTLLYNVLLAQKKD